MRFSILSRSYIIGVLLDPHQLRPPADSGADVVEDSAIQVLRVDAMEVECETVSGVGVDEQGEGARVGDVLLDAEYLAVALLKSAELDVCLGRGE